MAGQPPPPRHQLIQFPVEGGLDEFSDARHVDPAQLLDCKNVRMRKRGRLGKRYGNTLVEAGSGTGVTGQARMWSYQNQVLVGNGTAVYSITQGATTTKRRSLNNLPPTQISRDVIMGMTSNPVSANITQAVCDVAYGAGITCAVWKDGTEGVFDLFDAVTGTPFGYSYSTRIAAVQTLRCGYLSNQFYVAVSYTGSTNIDVYIIPITAPPTATTVVNLTAAHIAGRDFDFVIDTRLNLVYQNGANSDLYVQAFNAAGASTAGPTIYAAPLAGTKTYVRASTNGTNIFFTWCVTNGGTNYVQYAVHNASTCASVLAVTTIASSAADTIYDSTVTMDSSSKAVFAYGRQSTLGRWIAVATGTSAGVVVAGSTRGWGRPGSGLAKVSTDLFALWVDIGESFGAGAYGVSGGVLPAPTTAFISKILMYVPISVADVATFRFVPEGIADLRLAQHSPNTVPSLRNASSATVTRFTTISVYKSDGFASRELSLIHADVAFTTGAGLEGSRWRGAEVGKHLPISGGLPLTYDGYAFREIGFLMDVQGPWTTTINAAAGTFAVGTTYAWVFVYKRMDHQGQVLRGAPSAPVDVTFAGAVDAITFTVPASPYRDNSTQYDFYLEVYRTVASGSVFYLLGTTIPAAVGALTFSFQDTYAITDAILATRPQLYTTGGAVPNVIPPASRYMFGHKQRVLSLTKDQIWYTKLILNGEAPAFADEFTIDAPGSDFVCAASMDDFAVIFEKNKIWVLRGEGPNDLANGNDYSIVPVASDLGCVDPGSMIVHANGIFFRSRAGLYNLNRGLQVEHIGKFIEDELTSSIINSAIVHPNDHVILFNLTGGTPGRRLVWDYVHQQWLKDIIGEVDINGSAVIDGVLYYATSSAGVYKEDQTTHLDAGVWVPGMARFGNVKYGGTQGYHRVREFSILAERMSAHGLTLTIYNDYQATATTSRSYTEAAITALTDLPVYSVDVTSTIQIGSACSLKVEDTAPSVLGTGAGVAILAIATDGKVEEGLGRNPAANRR